MSRLVVPNLDTATGELGDISLAFATTAFTYVFNRINDTELDFPAVA